MHLPVVSLLSPSQLLAGRVCMFVNVEAKCGVRVKAKTRMQLNGLHCI